MSNKNFYQIIPDEFKKPLATYPNESITKIELPVRFVVAGSSGSGKTQAVLNIIDQFDCWNRFYLFVADPNESLYRFLVSFVTMKYGKKAINVCDDIGEMPEVNTFDPKCNNLVIIDDMINEKGSKHLNAINIYTKGRRANISIIYITQDFFKLNLTIRKNSKIIVLTGFDDESDLSNILRKYKGKLTMDQIKALYDYAREDGKENFFLIDAEGKPEYRFRRNLQPIGRPKE